MKTPLASDAVRMVDDAFAASEARRLQRTWQNPFRGVRAFVSEVDHKIIGKRFVITAFVFFALAGVLALVMRLQLALPENDLVGPDLYNQLFTVHGTTMMFLFAVPVVEGLGLYFVPLMIGARSLAFPRLNAFSYFTYLIGGVLLYVGLLCNVGPDAGWFSYVPLAGPEHGPGKRVDIWAQMVTFTELSAISGAVNLVATIFKHRAPGMTLDRMPLFVWSELVASMMIIFAMPAVMLGSLLLALDRLVGTHFFNPLAGGDVLLWQHLFWFFGHPEVYIIFLPALGMLSTLIAAFARRQIVGYSAMVLSLIATGFIGFGVWVHHMFTAGVPEVGASFFTAASLMIVLPTGVQFFCWLATLLSGRIVLVTPMRYALAFFVVFLIGGLTGVMLASVPLDTQVHDTFFVVAHLHYVLIGGMVFPLLGAISYWFPKAFGRMLDERVGRLAFWIIFAGFNLVFFPMHFLGVIGMPRRIYSYGAEQGFAELNQLATAGAFILGLGLAVFFVNCVVCARRGAVAGDDPWDGEGLEWSTTSPPPIYNFALLPTVSGRYARWSALRDQPVVIGVRSDRREVLVTELLDADPDHRKELPGPTAWPFCTALATGVLFIGFIFTPLAFLLGFVIVGVTLTGWFWPSGKPKEELAPEQP